MRVLLVDRKRGLGDFDSICQYMNEGVSCDHALTYEEALNKLRVNRYSEVYLEYHLDFPYTGFDVLFWLYRYPFRMPMRIKVISNDFYGVKRMFALYNIMPSVNCNMIEA